MNSRYPIVDLLNESAIFLHTLLLVDKKSAEKIILEMIKNSVLVVNYMEKTNEFYKDEFLPIKTGLQAIKSVMSWPLLALK